jgi:6-pyruvoyltetrahydropterin/6-carboxytetrahydropterin synthase
MLITRRVEFSASHVCHQPDPDAPENRPHGHNFVAEVTLRGTPDPTTGMVFDLKQLKEILNREVVEPYDHRFLNHEVPPFDSVVPTVENIARDMWRRLQPHFATDGLSLHSVRVFETDDLFVDYYGDDA